MVQRGGKREGAGRKPGYRLRKTAADVLADIEARHPGWSPLQFLAEIADDKNLDLVIRMDAAKCLAGFMHPKPKPAEFEPDQVIEFEKRLAEAVTEVKLAAAARAIEQNPGLFGLGDRLARAYARINLDEIIDDAPLSSTQLDSKDPEDDESETISSASTPKPAFDAEPTPQPAAEPYRPIISRPATSGPAYDPHGNL